MSAGHCGMAEVGKHTVMTPKADMAPAKTVRRGCLMAMIAAMINVSSPSSVTRICQCMHDSG